MTAIESMHCLSNLKYAGIFNYIEEVVFMIKKKSSNLHKINLLSKRYIIRNANVMEN